MNTTYSTLPFIECPHCEKEFQCDDYYDIERGSELECQHCAKPIHVLSTETVVSVRLGQTKEDET